MALQPSKLTLYYRTSSECSARIRIAASLKQIPLTLMLCENRQLHKDPEYMTMNPQGTVPTLVAKYGNGESVTLRQTLIMLDFLEESYAGTMRLIPSVTDMASRIKARDLATLVACDVQPLCRNRTLVALKNNGYSRQPNWQRGFLFDGMTNYEALIKDSAGKYSIGDDVSIADVCLWPMVENASRMGLRDSHDLSLPNGRRFPTIERVVGECAKLDAFRKHRLFRGNDA